jgi:hypothetical protein
LAEVLSKKKTATVNLTVPEFDFPMQVRGGNIVLIKDYGGKTVVVLWLWESRDPVTEERVGEVFFTNKGTEQSPQIVSAARQLRITERGP